MSPNVNEITITIWWKRAVYMPFHSSSLYSYTLKLIISSLIIKFKSVLGSVTKSGHFVPETLVLNVAWLKFYKWFSFS